MATLARDQEMAALIEPLVSSEGAIPTRLAAVSLIHLRAGHERTPLLYQPSLIIIAQGRKIGFLGGRRIHYDAGQYLVQTLPLPFECETHASPDEPLLGLSVRLDPVSLNELVTAMGTDEAEAVATDSHPQPMASVAMTESMRGAVKRLLHTLHDGAELEALGNLRVRDVIFEALKGDQGPALTALVRNHGHYSRIVQVLSELHANYAREYSVEQLAHQANMSLSTFHHHFKAITQTSPVQYLKRLRLIKAQQLLSQDTYNVNQTANAVGYRSVPQFSRDYKRYFGLSPQQYRQQWRTPAAASAR